MQVNSYGPLSASIAFVGEAPGATEVDAGRPFVGESGQELRRMWDDANKSAPPEYHVPFDDIFLTNVLDIRPPKNDISAWISTRKKARDGEIVYHGRAMLAFIPHQIERLKSELCSMPNLRTIVVLGKEALWALTGETSIAKMRGSEITTTLPNGRTVVIIPTYHPAFILRVWANRWIAVTDFRRVLRIHRDSSQRPNWNFEILQPLAPTLARLEWLLTEADKGPLRLVCDIEIFLKNISCIGLAWSSHDAICIPFYYNWKNYWTLEEEFQLTKAIQRLFSHPNTRLCNQNISFDLQWLRFDRGLIGYPVFDTMIAQNLIFPGTLKALDFISSLYCRYYLYWKEDSKFWEDASLADRQLFTYNCTDCVRTFEVWEAQEKQIERFGLKQQMEWQMETARNALETTRRGVAVDLSLRSATTEQIFGFLRIIEYKFAYLIGGQVNLQSPKQLQDLFYGVYGCKPVWRDTPTGRSISVDDEALDEIIAEDAVVGILAMLIKLHRSYVKAVQTINAKTDWDNRWRTFYDPSGTSTYRLASRQSALGTGLNLQNITSGKDI